MVRLGRSEAAVRAICLFFVLENKEVETDFSLSTELVFAKA